MVIKVDIHVLKLCIEDNTASSALHGGRVIIKLFGHGLN